MGEGCGAPEDSRPLIQEWGVGLHWPGAVGGSAGSRAHLTHLVCLFPVATQEKEEDPFNYGEHRRAQGGVLAGTRVHLRWGAKEAAPFPEPSPCVSSPQITRA